MKYFTHGSDNAIIGSASATRRFLRDNPHVGTVVRWWWSGNDLIECEDYSREEILGATAEKLNRGATAQWAVDHHAI